MAGAASRDLAVDDPRGWRLGGPATYCSLALARFGVRVGCVLGVDDAAAAAHELELLVAAGVDLRIVRLGSGPVFENIEMGGHRRQRWLSRCEAVPFAALPAEWRRAMGWLLVPVAGEIGPDWAEAPRAAEAGAHGRAGKVPEVAVRVGVGWQGLVREFGADGWVERLAPERSSLLDVASLVVASVDDFVPTTSRAALGELASGATIVLTDGEAGGVALIGGKQFPYRAIPAPDVVDPTGAGDVFLAASMAAWLFTGELATPQALRLAAAAASCSVEGTGLTGIPTWPEVLTRAGSVAEPGEASGARPTRGPSPEL